MFVKEIHLFISSGSGLISDQVSGTSYQMQRGLDLISSEKLGKGKSCVFKSNFSLMVCSSSLWANSWVLLANCRQSW
jgi:hypothetical protein